jgi:mannose-6-phosphate isomerase-like protein (cupin superfamily)
MEELFKSIYAKPNGVNMASLVTRVDKEWGSETIYCRFPHAAKVMRLKPGYQVSTHLHCSKTETFILISGQLTVEVFDRHGNNKKVVLEKPFDAITIEYMTPHTFYCPEGQVDHTVFIEASTQDTDEDNYRITKSGPRP